MEFQECVLEWFCWVRKAGPILGNVVCMVYGIASSKHLFKDDEHLNSRDLELDPFLFAFRFLLAQKVIGTCRNFIDSTRPLDPQPLPLSFAASFDQQPFSRSSLRYSQPLQPFQSPATIFSPSTAFSYPSPASSPPQRQPGDLYYHQLFVVLR